MATDQWIGREILGYRVESFVGRGGMGVVYRAHDLRLKRSVALKLVAPELSQDERFRERFLAETELVTSLEHPNVVPIYDAGDADGRLYLAMRFVEGSDLKSLLAREGPLEPAKAVEIAAQVGAALDAAHEHGLVHRDVKPSNILLDARGHAYLTDFGLARRLGELAPSVATEVSLGTPAYASPEQISGGDVDGRADVYALGCLLYECLAGTVPYPRDSELAVLWAHLQEAPPAIPAYPQLGPVVSTALAKDRDDRYQTCGELVEAAREALGARDVVVVRDRRPVLLVAVGALVLAGALAAGLVLSLGGGGPSKPSTKPTLTPKVDSLQRIDPKTNKLAATIGIGRFPTAVAVGAGKVWAGTLEDQKVVRIDPATNQITGAVTTGGTGAIAVGYGSVWVSTYELTLLRVDPDTLASATAGSNGSEGWRSIAVGEGGVWTAGWALDHVSRGGDSLASLTVGLDPFVVAASRGSIWVLDDAPATIWRVDPATNRVAGSIPLGFDPGGMAFARDRLWVANNSRDALVEIDPSTGRILSSTGVGHGPVGVAAGEGSVWVANYRDGTVSRVDPDRGSVTAIISVGKYPTAVVAGAGGAWVTVRAS